MTDSDIRTVAQWMEARGVAAAELEARARIDPRILQAILEGRYTPSPEQRQRIAAALDVGPEQIHWGQIAVQHLRGQGTHRPL